MESAEDQFSALDEGDPFVFDLGVKGGNERKRRFSEEQIKSLEMMFETQTKLEPRKKLQLARELGLQPRQVAIWFQNKRARWKSKQLFQNQAFHCSNFQLASFNVCEQLQKLTESLEKQREGSNNEGESDNRDSKGKEAAASTSLTSTEQECCFDCTSLPDQQWWEFWPMTE